MNRKRRKLSDVSGRGLFDAIERDRHPKVSSAELSSLWKSQPVDSARLYDLATERLQDHDEQTRSMQIDLGPLECAVCYLVITPPVMMCQASHVICADCSRKVQGVCPQCRQQVCLRNLALEKMVEKLVIRCGHHARGCRETFLGSTLGRSYVMALEHEASCRFAPVRQCPLAWMNCTKCHVLADLETHLTSSLHGFRLKERLPARKLFCLQHGLDMDAQWCRLVEVNGHKLAYVIAFVSAVSTTHGFLAVFALHPDAVAAIGEVTASIRAVGQALTKAPASRFTWPEVPYAGDELQKVVGFFPKLLFSSVPGESGRLGVEVSIQCGPGPEA